MKISIIGLGLIGGSIAQGLKNNHEISVLDLDLNSLEAAKKSGFKVLNNLDDALNSELIILSAPTSVSEEILKELSSKKYKNFVSDICSVKASLQDAAKELNYVGTHPMAGSTKAGFINANPEIFKNAPWAVSITSNTNNQALIAIVSIINELGAFIVPVDPIEHDESVVLSSHLAHVVASAYAKSVGESEFAQLAQLLAGGSFRDLTRVTTSPAERTAEIVWPNRKSLSKVVENLRENLAKLQHLLEQGSQADIEKYLQSASSLRTISDATINKVKNHQGEKVTTNNLLLKDEFLKYAEKRIIATDFVFGPENISYLINEI